MDLAILIISTLTLVGVVVLICKVDSIDKQPSNDQSLIDNISNEVDDIKQKIENIINP